VKKLTRVMIVACCSAAIPAMAADRTGDQVVGAVCSNCHGSGVMGAPKVGDTAAWAPRISKGTPTLHNHAIKGYNSMPARGGCPDCSDAELSSAVDYMVSKSK